MAQRYYRPNQLNIPIWPLLCLGLAGIILFILLLPLFLGVVVVFGAVAGFVAWRVNKFFNRMERQNIWHYYNENDDQRHQVIDITPIKK